MYNNPNEVIAHLQLVSGHEFWRYEEGRFKAVKMPSESDLAKKVSKLLVQLAHANMINDISGEFKIPFLPPGGGKQVLLDVVSIGKEALDFEKLNQRVQQMGGTPSATI